MGEGILQEQMDNGERKQTCFSPSKQMLLPLQKIYSPETLTLLQIMLYYAINKKCDNMTK